MVNFFRAITLLIKVESFYRFKMRHFRRYGSLIFGGLFVASFSLSLLLYLLRGSGVLVNLPGGIILFLMAVAIVTGIIFGIEQTKS